MSEFLKRRAGQLRNGSDNAALLPTSPLAPYATDSVFGVDDGPEPFSVNLRLGPHEPMFMNREVSIALALLVLKRAVGNGTAPPAMRNAMIDMSLLMLRGAGAEVDLGHKE